MLINSMFTDGYSVGSEIEKILNTLDINEKVRDSLDVGGLGVMSLTSSLSLDSDSHPQPLL